MSVKRLILLLPVLLAFIISPVNAQQVITLSWNDVVGISKQQNLEIEIQHQEYRRQRLSEWKALTDFLPSLSYSYQATNNIERPVFVIPNIGEVRFGTEYNFTQVLQLQYPLFTGGARWANWRIQKNVKKSLQAQLQNKKDEVVFNALQSYFNIILSEALIDVNRRAYETASANLEQVEKFYNAGASSKLDYLRAKSRLSSTKPQLTTAINNRKLAMQNLKFILNIDPDDSLVVLDTLHRMEFLERIGTPELSALQDTALQQRKDLSGMRYQKKAAGDQKIVSASQFLPSIVLSGNVQHQAQLDNTHVAPEDYVRSKSASISLQIPLFQGGKRVLDYQQSRINEKKSELQVRLLKRSIQLEVENSYNQWEEAIDRLGSLQQAMQESREALRLADLTYKEGISTQLDVLNAQLAFTTSEVQYRQGVFNYNISQLRLLKSIGQIDKIWE